MTFKSFACCACLIAAPLAAQGQPQLGCYERIYSKAHLAENPQQGVAALRVLISKSPQDAYVGFTLATTMADQGQGRADGVAGQTLETWLSCFADGSQICYSDGDAGRIEIINQGGNSMTFRTGGLLIGFWEEGYGYGSNLDEPTSGPTTYRVNAVPAAQCAGMD